LIALQFNQNVKDLVVPKKYVMKNWFQNNI
jgi:hypothetical protein